MNILRIFGIGSDRILSRNHCVNGTVTDVTLSSLHTIKKPVRLYSNSDNTMYSHFITFEYMVDSLPYKGKLFVDLRFHCPQKGETIDVYYDPEKPENYACYAFGSGGRQIGW